MTRTFFILTLLPSLAAAAQQPLVLLDPARGGSDSGARIADRTPEKQVTLDLAGRLASLLRARGFAVQMTREADVDMSGDARAALANNTHPLACILLYAGPSGSGVHLYTSALRQKDAVGAAVRWDEAQAAYADRSRTLAADLREAMDHGRVTASIGQTWQRPLDNMECPAVAVELLPEKNGTGAENSSYQSHVANAVANTLLQWRAKVAAATPVLPQPPVSVQKPPSPPPQQGDEQAAPRPAPATTVSPGEKPGEAPASQTQTKPAPTAVRSLSPGTVAPNGSAPSAGEAAPRRTPKAAPVIRQTPVPPAPVTPDRTEP